MSHILDILIIYKTIQQCYAYIEMSTLLLSKSVSNAMALFDFNYNI